MVSDLETIGLICLKKLLWKKLRFQVFKFYVFLVFFAFFFKVILWTNIAILLQIWDQIFKTVFFSTFLFCFLFKAQNCLDICVNCAWNCVTPLFTPLEVQFSKNLFSKTYSSLIWNARLTPKVTFVPYWWEESGIFLIRGPKSHNFA